MFSLHWPDYVIDVNLDIAICKFQPLIIRADGSSKQPVQLSTDVCSRHIFLLFFSLLLKTAVVWKPKCLLLHHILTEYWPTTFFKIDCCLFVKELGFPTLSAHWNLLRSLLEEVLNQSLCFGDYLSVVFFKGSSGILMYSQGYSPLVGMFIPVFIGNSLLWYFIVDIWVKWKEIWRNRILINQRRLKILPFFVTITFIMLGKSLTSQVLCLV